MFGLLSDLGKIVLAPVQVATNLTRVVTAPVAELAQEVVKEVKQSVDEVIK